jgi:hypothetical protein
MLTRDAGTHGYSRRTMLATAAIAVPLEARAYPLAIFLSLAALEPFLTLAGDGFGGALASSSQRSADAPVVGYGWLHTLFRFHRQEPDT